MRKSSTIAISIAIVVFIWLLSGFFFGEKSQDEKADIDLLEKVVSINSTASEFPIKTVITGKTQPFRAVDIKARVDGRILSIDAKKSDKVLKDQLIAEIDKVDRVENVEKSKNRLKYRKMQYDAAANLAGSGFNSKIRLAEAKSDLQTAKADLAKDQYLLDSTFIKAPFDGVISKQFIEIGDYVSPTQNLFQIIDINPIVIQGFASENQVLDLILGQDVSVELVDGRQMTGKLAFVSPIANTASRTFRIEVEVDNKNADILSGLTSKLTFLGKKVLAHKVTKSALTLDDDGRIGVMIVDDQNIAQFKHAEIVQDTADAVWLSGLNEKERIITTGHEFVVSGQEVNATQ